jgi:hypothetical protein
MKPFDDQDARAPESVPELIRILWSLYMAMSLDPATAEPAQHVRAAALELEQMRRMALQVCQEEQEAALAGCGNRAKKTKSTKNAKGGVGRGRKSRERDKAVLEWLRNAPPASPWKH